MNNLKTSEYKVVSELFRNPSTPFHIRELARKTELNPNTIINVMDKLENQGLIKRESKKHLVEVSLNLENKETIWKKRIFNLNEIYSSGIIDFLVKEYNPKSISLIGSYSKGEDIEKSDIDLVIFSDKKEIVNLSKYEKILDKKIHLLILSGKISDEFYNNLINGVILYGYLRK